MKRKTSSSGKANKKEKPVCIAKKSTGLSSRFNESTYADCQIKFKASGRTLHLHKLILCSESDYFKTCFSVGMKETRKNQIVIEDDDETLLTCLLQSLYSNEIIVQKKKDLVPLIILAEKYMLTDCATQIAEYLSHNVTSETVMRCLDLDLDKYPNIKIAFTNFGKRNYSSMLAGSAILSLDESQLSVLLSIVINIKNGMEGIKAMTRWIEHDEEERAGFSFALTKTIETASSTIYDWSSDDEDILWPAGAPLEEKEPDLTYEPSDHSDSSDSSDSGESDSD